MNGIVQSMLRFVTTFSSRRHAESSPTMAEAFLHQRYWKIRDSTWRVVRTLGNRNRRRRRRGRRWERWRRGARNSAGATRVGVGERGHECKGSSGTESAPLDLPGGAPLVRLYTILGTPQVPQNIHALVFHLVRHQKGQNRGETVVCRW